MLQLPYHRGTSNTKMADSLPCTFGTELDQEKRKRRRRGPRLTGVSKQRRLANARERKRVQILNEKIEILRDLLPISPIEKKPTKTEVIWLAASYIGELTSMLQDSAGGQLERVDTEEDFLDIESLLNFDLEDLFNF